MSGVVSAEPVTGSSAAAGSIRAALTSEAAVLAAMIVAVGVFYLGPGAPAIVVGLLAFFALAVYRPELSLVLVPLAVPLFYRPRLFPGNLYFPLAEVIIWVCVAAWISRDVGSWLLGRRNQKSEIRNQNLEFREPKLKTQNSKLITQNPFVILALALGLIGIIWLLVPEAAYRRFAIREFRWTVLEPLLFFALMLRWLRTERDLWRLVAAWLVAAALVGREGVEQFLFGNTWAMEGVGRVTSVYPGATAFGIYMGRALPLALVLAVFLPAQWRLWRIACALLSVSIGLGVLFSFARGAWVGVAAAMLAVALITRHRGLLVGLGVAAIAGLAALPFISVERIRSMFDFSTPDNTGLARGKIWSSALDILRDHPFTGIGQDQLLYVDEKVRVPHVRFLTLSHPHNWVLDFWLRLGLPGLVWIFAALGIFFWQAVQLWRANRGTALGALALGLIAAMIDLAVHGLLDMAYFTMDSALTFWLMVGLLAVMKKSEVR